MQLNYLFIPDAHAAQQLKSFLRSENIMLHAIKAQEMQHIISYKDTMPLQKKYGNSALADAFLQYAERSSDQKGAYLQ